MKNTLKTEFPGIGDAQFHIRLTEGQISPYVLLPGAPERVELVKKQWKNAVDLEFNREFRSAKGTYDGMDIACVSTGIGTTSAEICLHAAEEHRSAHHRSHRYHRRNLGTVSAG